MKNENFTESIFSQKQEFCIFGKFIIMPGIFRFSNAVSDIDKFIDTYKRIYAYFIDSCESGQCFDHIQAAEFLALNGLASSLGAIGEEALRRSTRTDKSRDPLYNQHKSYSEIFRMLGWYEPGTMQTNFKLSEYGFYIANQNVQSVLKQLFETNILHVVSPNPLTTVRGNNILRPFPLILKLMYYLDEIISRDEIIIGVLTCMDDRNNLIFRDSINEIKTIRNNGFDSLEQKLARIRQENNISSLETLGNYTRFPISALKWTELVEQVKRKDIYGNHHANFLKLSVKGKEKAESLLNIPDIRYEDLSNYDDEEKAAFSVLSNLEKLENAGYDLGNYKKAIPILKEKCMCIRNDFNITDTNYLFFGYQETPRDILAIGDTILDAI